MQQKNRLPTTIDTSRRNTAVPKRIMVEKCEYYIGAKTAREIKQLYRDEFFFILYFAQLSYPALTILIVVGVIFVLGDSITSVALALKFRA